MSICKRFEIYQGCVFFFMLCVVFTFIAFQEKAFGNQWSDSTWSEFDPAVPIDPNTNRPNYPDEIGRAHV